MQTGKAVQTLIGAALLVAGFVSCSNATTGTRTVSGTITTMNATRTSITVAGQTLSLSSAPVAAASLGTQSEGPSHVSVNGSDANEHALSVGQHVDASVDNNNHVTDINVHLELKGSIESIGTGSLVVAGKTVTVNASTRFDVEGPGDDDDATSTHTLADLKVGDFIEVTGSTDATTGNVTATKIEVKTGAELGEDGEDGETEFKGSVSGLSGSSFMLGENTVNCSGACTLPTGLKNGDFVEAEGSFDAATKTLTASKVKLEDASKSGSSDDGSGHH